MLDMGIGALERGWITPEALTNAVTLYRTGAYDNAHELWVKSSLLTMEQANELYRPVDVSFTEALYGERNDAAAGHRYVVERTLSEGGFGRILICQDRALGRRVAIKALRHDLHDNEHARSLAREARVTGNLEHPSIIPVYDAGIAEDEGPFYVMRLVEQYSLEHVLSSLRKREPTISATWTLSRLLRTYIQACQAVHYAHSRGVIHCDLKPSNILLGSFGEVLVSDWGMAYSRDHGQFIGGGTPAYMAPEQLDESVFVFDARTDVFALGVVLYRILALRSPFRGTHVSEVLRQRQEDQVPPLPSSVAPADRPVPAELEDIAMQAMEADPAKRQPSAEALARAIEAFLEGTLEREHRQRRAAGLVEQGDELAARYHETREEWQKLAGELATLSLSVDPWQPLDERRKVWDAEDELAIMDALLVRTLQEAISSYEQALVEQPKHPAARSGLARLYADRVERARERRADFDRLYFEGLLRQYDDDGILLRAGGRPGWLNISLPDDVEDIALAPVEERDRQLITGAERRLRRSALEAVPAAPGSYVLHVRLRGRRLRIPVLVRGDRETEVRVELDPADMPREDEIYIPGGVASLGAELGGHRVLRDQHVPSCFIQTFPVTFGQYLEFLESVRRHEPDRVAQLLPHAREDAPLWTIGAGGLTPTRALADVGMRPDSWASIPVFGIDGMSAMEYADWWSARTGKRYRLPTEAEWEKAARGVDARRYPWGDRFEALFCKMMHSRPGRPVPEPVGTFASDVSPYGVRDMAGGIADWCTPVTPETARGEHGTLLASRGGAWCDADTDCTLTARRRVAIEERSYRLGMRLVRDVL
jgi:serine/threonine-protein kinase